MTQLEVIQKFMGALDNHGYVSDGTSNSDTNLATAMLDEAIRACSTYNGIEDAMSKFLSAAKSSADSSTFLTQCGINLNNADTGGILGYDAGTSTVEKDSDTTVLEVGNLYTADNTAAQNIKTGNQGWLVSATNKADTIISSGEDSINAGKGNDLIVLSGRTASVVTGGNADTVSVSGDVKYFTVKDYVEGTTQIIGAENYDSTIDGGTAFYVKKGFSTVISSSSNSSSSSGIVENGVAAHEKPEPVASTSEILKVTSVTDTEAVNSDDTISVDLSEVDTVSGYYVKTAASVSAFSSTHGTNDLVGTVSSNFVGDYLNEDSDGNLSFTYRGLTLNIIGERNPATEAVTSYINANNFSALNNTSNSKYYQYVIISGLYKWWLKESLDINEKAMGFGFTDENVAVNQINLYFENDSSSDALAYVMSRNIDKTGRTRGLDLVINSHYFGGLTNENDPNCEAYVNNSGGTLDRTLAHEFNHADFSANVNYFSLLPMFIKEGMAELVHGVDDERKTDMQTLLNNTVNNNSSDMLSNYINLATSIPNSGGYPYAAGYMFLRWLAKTVADSNSVPLGEISAQVNLGSGSGIYYVSGTSANIETANLSSVAISDSVSVGTSANNIYTANDGIKQIINTGTAAQRMENVGSNFTVNAASSSANNTVLGYGGNISVIGGSGADYVSVAGENNTINGGAGNDTIYSSNAAYNNINGGTGNDSIVAGGQGASIFGGAGNDTVIDNTRSSAQYINLGDGNNLFDNTDTQKGGNYATNSNTIIGGTGGDTVKALWANSYTIELGDGANNVSIAGADTTINGGAGNDSITLNYSQSSLNAVDAGGGNNYILLENGASYNTITAGEGADSINIGGHNNYISVGAGNDTISFMNYNTPSINAANNIDAGDGNDFISLFSNDNTITTGDGNDTIQVSNYSNINYTISAAVTDFNENDVISFVNTVSDFSFDNNSKILTAGKTSITLPNIDTSDEINSWGISGTTAAYTKASGGKFNLSSNRRSISYTAGESSTLVTVSGVISADGLSLNEASSTVTVASSSLGTDTVTISTGYTLALGSDVTTSTSTGGSWNFNNSAAIYTTAGTTAGYTLIENTITYSAETGGSDLVTVNGVISADGLSLNEAESTVTVASSSLGTDTVTISTDYTLALGSDVATSTNTGGSWNFNNSAAIYKTAGTTAGYTLSENKITYSAETGGSELVTVGGVISADGLSLNEASSTVTVSSSSLGTDTVTISTGYNLALGSDVTSNANYRLVNNTIVYSEVINMDTIISNSIDNTIVTGTADADSISNTGNNVTINSGGGNDTISNSGSGVVVTGENLLYNFSGTAGGGQSAVTLNGAPVTLSASTNSDLSNANIISQSDNAIVSIGGVKLNDTITTSEDKVFNIAYDTSNVTTDTAVLSVNSAKVSLSSANLSGSSLSMTVDDSGATPYVTISSGIATNSTMTVGAGVYNIGQAVQVTVNEEVGFLYIDGNGNVTSEDYSIAQIRIAREEAIANAVAGLTSPSVGAFHDFYNLYYGQNTIFSGWTSTVAGYANATVTNPATVATAEGVNIYGDTSLGDYPNSVTLQSFLSNPINIEHSEGLTADGTLRNALVDVSNSNNSLVALGMNSLENAFATNHSILGSDRQSTILIGSKAIGNNVVIAGNGGNFIYNAGGTASLFGGIGSDTIYASQGDHVEGGGGADYFFDSGDYEISDYNFNEGDVIIATKLSTVQALTPDILNISGNKIAVNGGATLTVGESENSAVESTTTASVATIANYDATKAIIADAAGSNRTNLIWAGTSAGILDASDMTSGAMIISSVNGGGNSILGSDSADTIYAGSNDYVDGGGGNDTIYNMQANSTLAVSGEYSAATVGNDVVVTVGEDTVTLIDAASLSSVNITVASAVNINNTVEGASLTGTLYDDTISNTDADNVTIKAIGGNDYITNTDSDKVYIDAGDGNNTVVTSLYFNWYLTDVYQNNTIIAGAGADYVSNSGGYGVDVYSGDGNDTIYNYHSYYSYIEAGNGDDSVVVERGAYQTVDAGAGNDTILGVRDSIGWAMGGLAELYGGDGDDYINVSTYVENSYIDGGEGNDIIIASGPNNSIYGGNGNDFIQNIPYNNNSTDYVYMNGGDGNDTIQNYGSNSEVYGGAGDDSIENRGSNSYIDAGEGNNIISLTADAANNTITGNGYTTIYSASSNGNIYKFVEGSEVISGYNENDTILIENEDVTYSTSVSGNNFIISTSNGSTTLLNAATIKPIIQTAQVTHANINNTASDTVITGTNYADTITNSGANVTINALGGNDTVTNTASNVKIDAGDGSNRISNEGANVTIETGSGKDFITNTASNVTINAGAGYNTVSNSGGEGLVYQYSVGETRNDMLIGFTNKDTILVYGEGYTTVEQGNFMAVRTSSGQIFLRGNDIPNIVEAGASISNTVDNTLISGTDRNDIIHNSGSNVTIEAKESDDLITNTDANKVYIDAGEGDNSVISSLRYDIVTVDGEGQLVNYYSDTTIVTGDGNNYIENTGGYNLSVVSGSGNDTIFNTHGYYPTISTGAGNDSVVIGKGHYQYIDAGDGNDTIVGTLTGGEGDWKMGGNATLIGGAGDDYIDATDSNDSSILGGAGNDTIIASGPNAYVNGGDGDDSIVVGGYNNTINGGAGNDTITATIGGNIYNYTNGDGNDLIIGFTSSDTLIINDTGRQTSVSGNDLVITAGEGSITLSGAATLDSVNISVPYENTAAYLDNLLLQKTEAGYPVVAGMIFHPNESHGDEPNTDTYVKETLTITSADGLELSGVHYTPENSNDKWVILIHGYGHDHTAVYSFAKDYLANGYNVLAVDQRAAGDSQGEYLTLGAAEAEDIARWTKKIAEINSNAKITLHGVSMGAATAMLAAARSDITNVTSIVEDCGYTNAIALANLLQAIPTLGVTDEMVDVMDYVAKSLTGYYIHQAAPIDSISSVTLPSMFITGTADMIVPLAMTESLYSASGAETKEIFTVEGAEHGDASTVDAVGYNNAVFRFNAEADGEGWQTTNTAASISLRGTKYDDTITNNASNVTINAGAGDDTITNSGNNNVYIYNSGDGNDVIVGVTSNDTILINGSTYSTVNDGDDKIINIVSGQSSITLKNAASLAPFIQSTAYVDKDGNVIENPVAQIESNGLTYYYESVARAANDADDNSTVMVVADSTETSTINSSKGLTIQFAKSGLGVYSVSGGNFVSAGDSSANFSISADKVLSNSNSLLINNGGTSTLDGYVVTGTANGYSFALQENALTFDGISYSGAGSATFDTLGKISLTSGAVVSGTNDVTSSTGINIAAGDYTINDASITASTVKTIYANADNVQFQLASDTLNYNDMIFSGSGYATVKDDLPTLSAGVIAERPERIMVVLTESGQNTLDGRGFWLTENISDGITVGAIDNGIGAQHIVPYESFPEDAGKLFAEEALIYGDDNYTMRLDKDGIRSIFGISSGATVRGNAYLDGEIDTLGSILQFGLDGAGVYQLGNKAYTITGGAWNDSVVIGMLSRFYNDGTSSLRAVQSLSGTISGDFSDGVTVSGSSSVVSITGDTNVNVIADTNGVQTISGVSNGASVNVAGGATVVSTDEEGAFQFRSGETQGFTISGDDSVDFILQNYTLSSGSPTMQVAGVTNFENGTLIIDDKTAFTKINSTNEADELAMTFTDTATFVIADSKVVSVDGIDALINNLKDNVTVHATKDIIVNDAYANVAGDSDFNVIVTDGKTTGLNNISAGATVSVDSMAVTTDENGEFTFATNTYTINDTDNSVTFLTRFDGTVEGITNFEGTLKSSAQSVTVNGAAFTTSNTDASIISAGVGISRIAGLVSGDSVSGSLDTTTILIPSTNNTDTSIITVNSAGYTLANDSDGVEITGNRLDGLNNNASLMVGAAGTYIVNDETLTAQIGDIFIGTAEGAAYIYDPNNLPLDITDMDDEEIASQAGVNTAYSVVETDTMRTTQLLDNGGTALDGAMALVLDNSYTISERTIDFSTNTGKKKVTLEGGEQSIKFNDEGGNIAVIETDSTGEKNVSLGGGGDLVIIRGTSAEINIFAGTGKDTIVTAGKDVLVNMSSGGATKIVPNGGSVIFEDYNASTGAGVQLNDVADIKRAILGGNVTLGSGQISFGDTTINLGNNNADSTMINLFDNKGISQKVGYTNDGGELDASGERENLLLIGKGNSSRFTAGRGDDTAIGGAGDYFDLGGGSNQVILQSTNYRYEGATIALTAANSRTEVDGFNFGYNDNADNVRMNISNAQVAFKDGQLVFTSGNGGKLILNDDLGSGADLIADDNFIGNTTLDDITAINYEQGDYQFATARDTLSSDLQLTFAQG